MLLTVPPEAVAGFEEAARNLAAASWKAREIAKLSVPVGILSGLIAGALYNRYSDIKLPDYLAFFGGRRFVPIAAGFVGLVVPHLVRLLGLADHRSLLPGSVLAGGGFLVLADTIARSAWAPLQFPVGVLTALLGVPILLLLLAGKNKDAAR